jgi:glycerol kinase
MSVIVAIDAGTTGVRAVAVREDSSIVCFAYREFPQHFPRPGWVEHDPMEIWNALQVTVAELALNLDEPVIAIGVANQRETVVAWSRSTGLPLHRAIVWQDRRTTNRCVQLENEGHLPLVRSRTGLRLDPYFSGTKISWLLESGGVPVNPDLAIGTIDSWLIWKLTEGREHLTEPSNASRTLLFDIDSLHWSPELCDLFNVPIGALPEVRPSCGRLAVTGETTALGAGIAISGVAGDQQAALFGQACFLAGMSKNTYGTGSFVLMNVGETRPREVDGLLTTVAWTLGESRPPMYAYEGSIFATGASIQWLRDGLGIISNASEVGPLAESVETTGGVYLVPAFTGLGSPWWDPNARGAILGITRGTGRGELALATVESIAYQVRGVVDTMIKAAGLQLSELRVDGGASAMNLLLQLQADQLGVPVTRSARSETTALGVAYLAGLAEGVWSTTDDIASVWASDCTMQPTLDRTQADYNYHQWNDAVRRSLAWVQPGDAPSDLPGIG